MELKNVNPNDDNVVAYNLINIKFFFPNIVKIYKLISRTTNPVVHPIVKGDTPQPFKLIEVLITLPYSPNSQTLNLSNKVLHKVLMHDC
jgi:hypothetical protein